MVEPMIRLSNLPTAEPSAARSDRIRRTCRAQLARRAARVAPSAASAPRRRRGLVRLWQPTLALLALAYLAEVLGLALAMYRR